MRKLITSIFFGLSLYSALQFLPSSAYADLSDDGKKTREAFSLGFVPKEIAPKWQCNIHDYDGRTRRVHLYFFPSMLKKDQVLVQKTELIKLANNTTINHQTVWISNLVMSSEQVIGKLKNQDIVKGKLTRIPDSSVYFRMYQGYLLFEITDKKAECSNSNMQLDEEMDCPLEGSGRAVAYGACTMDHKK